MLPEHPGSRAMPLALISPWHFIFHFVYFHLWALFFQTKTSSHHFLFFWGKVLLCGSNWPGTYLDQGDLELREPPAFVSWVLRLKVCTSYLVFTLLNLYSSHYRHLAPWLLLSVYAHCVGSCEWTSTWRPLVNLMSFSQSHHFFFFFNFYFKIHVCGYLAVSRSVAQRNHGSSGGRGESFKLLLHLIFFRQGLTQNQELTDLAGPMDSSIIFPVLWLQLCF